MTAPVEVSGISGIKVQIGVLSKLEEKGGPAILSARPNSPEATVYSALSLERSAPADFADCRKSLPKRT